MRVHAAGIRKLAFVGAVKLRLIARIIQRRLIDRQMSHFFIRIGADLRIIRERVDQGSGLQFMRALRTNRQGVVIRPGIGVCAGEYRVQTDRKIPVERLACQFFQRGLNPGTIRNKRDFPPREPLAQRLHFGKQDMAFPNKLLQPAKTGGILRGIQLHHPLRIGQPTAKCLQKRINVKKVGFVASQIEAVAIQRSTSGACFNLFADQGKIL